MAAGKPLRSKAHRARLRRTSMTTTTEQRDELRGRDPLIATRVPEPMLAALVALAAATDRSMAAMLRVVLRRGLVPLLEEEGLSRERAALGPGPLTRL